MILNLDFKYEPTMTLPSHYLKIIFTNLKIFYVSSSIVSLL
jgi:hypothetical protein